MGRLKKEKYCRKGKIVGIVPLLWKEVVEIAHCLSKEVVQKSNPIMKQYVCI